MKFFSILAVILFSVLPVSAQQQAGVEFGKVSTEDFNVSKYNSDSMAGAVVVADIGNSDIVGNDQGWFSLHFKRYTRIHVLTKEGYSQADFSIVLYFNKDSKELVKNLSAFTYNLENGMLVKTELDTKKSVYTEKVDENHLRMKFAMPAVREGSIIECRYTIISEFIFNLQPWTFQGEFPHLWSEYSVSLPQFFNYISLTKGNQKFHIKSEKQAIRNYTVSQENESMYGGLLASDRITISASVSHIRWVMKNVPALKIEPFTSVLENHLSAISFQLSETRSPLVERQILNTWPLAVKDLLSHEKFGGELSVDKSWLRSIANKLTGKMDGEEDRVRVLFDYIRNLMSCTDRNSLMLSQSLFATYKKRSGNVADINMLLVAIMREGGFEAAPVILSLRSNGTVYNDYPILSQYNYVICRVMIDGKPIFLDATYVKGGYKKLPADCYNGQAYVIADEGQAVLLFPDSIKETSSGAVFMAKDSAGGFLGRLVISAGNFESVEIRESAAKEGTTALFSKLKAGLGEGVKIQDVQIDSLQNTEQPIQFIVDFNLAEFSDDIVYLNPMFGQGIEKNPFKSDKRLYPVEMPYARMESYIFEMDLPENYKVESLPKSVTMKLNGTNDAVFVFDAKESEGHISVRSRLEISRTFYSPSEYEMLREFFALVVKKHSEQIVFKKKP